MNLGDKEPCPFALHRSRYVSYGKGYEKSADVDASHLDYFISGLSSDKIYKLKLEFYQNETDKSWLQAIAVDGKIVDHVTLGRKKVSNSEIIIPAEAYTDGSINLKVTKVYGPKVIANAILVYEYTDDKQIHGPSLSEVHKNILRSFENIRFDKVSPNPTHGTPMICFTALNECRVSITLYDITGRTVDNVFDDYALGECNIPLRSENLSVGIYFIRIQADDEVFTDKILLLK